MNGSLLNHDVLVSQYIYFGILLMGIVLGMLRIRRLALASKFILLLIGYVFVKELIANFLAHKFSFNLSFYKFLSPVDYLLTLFIFFFIPLMKKMRWLIYILGVLVIVFYFYNLIFLQPPGQGIDSNFKMVRSVALVLLSLILFYRMIS